jgi:hypothetical protein
VDSKGLFDIPALKFTRERLVGLATPPLLDMRLEIAGVAARLEPQPRATRIARFFQRMAHHMAVSAVARLIEVVRLRIGLHLYSMKSLTRLVHPTVTVLARAPGRPCP